MKKSTPEALMAWFPAAIFREDQYFFNLDPLLGRVLKKSIFWIFGKIYDDHHHVVSYLVSYVVVYDVSYDISYDEAVRSCAFGANGGVWGATAPRVKFNVHPPPTEEISWGPKIWFDFGSRKFDIGGRKLLYLGVENLTLGSKVWLCLFKPGGWADQFRR